LRCRSWTVCRWRATAPTTPPAPLLCRLRQREKSRAAYDRAIALGGNTAKNAYVIIACDATSGAD
jgi:predicted RNA polymerase sigma factor